MVGAEHGFPSTCEPSGCPRLSGRTLDSWSRRVGTPPTTYGCLRMARPGLRSPQAPIGPPARAPGSRCLTIVFGLSVVAVIATCGPRPMDATGIAPVPSCPDHHGPRSTLWCSMTDIGSTAARPEAWAERASGMACGTSNSTTTDSASDAVRTVRALGATRSWLTPGWRRR